MSAPLNRPPRRRLRWALVALALLLLLALLGWRASGRKATPETVTATEVPVQLQPDEQLPLQPRQLRLELPVSGSLRAVDTAVIKARVAGEVRGLTLREGDAVTAGQTVARIEPLEYDARLRQAQEQASSARAQTEVAQRSFDNNQALVAQGFISRNALETSQSNLGAAQATHRAALAAAEVARKSLSDTVLRSPISGQVAQRFVQPGERVGVEARVLEIVDLRQLELEATLPAADAAAVTVGQIAQLRIEGSSLLGDAAMRTVMATVARVNPSVQPGSRNVLVYLRLAPDHGLRPGLVAQGQVAIGAVDALALPLSAVRTDKPQPYVQALVDGRVVHRTVQTGQRGQIDGQAWVALSGLDAGMTVVAGSVGLLREGTRVALAAPAVAPAAAAVRP